MNVSIKPGAATRDAQEIESIVSAIETNMEALNNAFKSTIPDGIQTTWSEKLIEDWNSFYTADIPNAMEQMKLSAANLRKAVDEALKYEK